MVLFLRWLVCIFEVRLILKIWYRILVYRFGNCWVIISFFMFCWFGFIVLFWMLVLIGCVGKNVVNSIRKFLKYCFLLGNLGSFWDGVSSCIVGCKFCCFWSVFWCFFIWKIICMRKLGRCWVLVRVMWVWKLVGWNNGLKKN